MNLLQAEPPEEFPERLEREAARTADRLRTLSLVRLSADLADGRSRAGAAFDLAQRLADRATGLAAAPARTLPALPDQAAGDVLAVCALDLAEALRTVGPPTPAQDQACRESVAELIALRRAL